MTASLARDLRSELELEINDLIVSLVSLLDCSNPDQLEDIFSTLGYLFKYMQTQLLSDIPNLFLAYRSLLSHSKPFIRNFAAESFAFLLRHQQRQHLPADLAYLVQHVCEDLGRDDSVNGLALTMVYTLRGIKGHLHSRAGETLCLFLRCCETHTPSDPESHTSWPSLRLAVQTLELLAPVVNPIHAQPVWDALEAQLSRAIEMPIATAPYALSVAVHLVGAWFHAGRINQGTSSCLSDRNRWVFALLRHTHISCSFPKTQQQFYAAFSPCWNHSDSLSSHHRPYRNSSGL